MKKHFLFFLLLIFFAVGCFQAPCDYISPPELEGFYSGSSIVLFGGQTQTFSSEYTSLADNIGWATPNGKYIEGRSLTIGPMTPEMAGEYRLISSNESCATGTNFSVEYQELNIPCAPLSNSFERIKYGIKSSTTVSRVQSNGFEDNSYTVFMSDGSQISFNFRQKPSPGVYDADGYDETNSQYSLGLTYRDPNRVSSSVSGSNNSKSPIYVSEDQGKILITLCSVPIIDVFRAPSTITGLIVLE